MKGHFDRHLNLRQLILDKLPDVVVECGAGNGDCTKLLAHLRLWHPYDLYSITDKKLDDIFIPGVEWKIGVSYKKFKEFQDGEIDMCIIDTDHNYWTLRTELEAVIPKMKEGGLVIMHDVEEFYYDTGMGMSYWDDSPYPEKEIRSKVHLGGVGLALIDFLHDFRGSFKLVRYLPEHYGVAVIEKRTVKETKIISPGTNPVFAKPPKISNEEINPKEKIPC